jgi:hypothetical protein
MARQLMKYFATSQGAWALSVNEVCRLDAADLVANQFPGVASYFLVTRKNVSGCDPDVNGNRDFGSMVFMWGTPTIYNTSISLTQGPGNACPASSSSECRAGYCLLNSTFAGYAAACTGHLYPSTNSDSSYAATQATQYVWSVNATYGTYARWIAGDFNLTPGYIPSGFPAQFFRSPYANTFKADSNPALLTKQIDYVWNDFAHSSSTAVLAPYCTSTATQASDHCYVFAQFNN